MKDSSGTCAVWSNRGFHKCCKSVNRPQDTWNDCVLTVSSLFHKVHLKKIRSTFWVLSVTCHSRFAGSATASVHPTIEEGEVGHGMGVLVAGLYAGTA